MLAQPKLLTWSATKSRIFTQLQYSAKLQQDTPSNSSRIFSLTSRVPQVPLFSSHAFAKYQFDTRLQAFAYYRSIDEDDPTQQVEDMLIASLLYNDPRDPRSVVYVYFTSLNTGAIRRTLKYDFQFPCFELLKFVPRLKLIVGFFNNRLYLLSNNNGRLKYLTSIVCPGKARRIIYDRTTRDIIYVGGDSGLFGRWYLVRESGTYDLRLGDRLKSSFISRQNNIIDMKLDSVSHKLFIVAHKGCLIFDTLLNRESASVLSAHGAPVTCANVYGFSIVMGFADGILKIFEIGTESIPVRYQIQAHQAPMISLLITADGVIVTGAIDGTVCFYSLDSLIKLGEHRFPEPIERMMLVQGEDILVKFENDLRLLTYTLPIRSFSSTLQAIEQARVTFPVGSIPSRVVTRSAQNLVTVYNPRSTQILNVIPLSSDRIVINDFVYDSAGEILYILTGKTVCSYHCATQPSYLINIFEVKEECLFTKLCCIMWFSMLPEHTKKRRAFGIVLVGTTNGKLYLVPGDHGLQYALLPDTPEALYSYFQVLNDKVAVDWLEIFQSYETYTTRRGERYLMAIGNDFVAKFYRLSISGHEIFFRELGVAIQLDAACIGAAMADNRIAIACDFRGYIRMYAISTYGLDEIAPKDILHEHSPIKSLTACDTTGLFASLNSINEIMLWAKHNEAVRKIRSDVPLISIANLNDRGDILLVSARRLYFLMMSDFAPEHVLFDLTKKQVKDDPIESPMQISKNFNPSLLQPPQTVQLDERAHPKSQVSTDLDESAPLGFFESIEHDRAQAEMAKMLGQKQLYPIAPDALIPNSTLRAMFKTREVEPVEVKMFRLRLISPPSADTVQAQLNDRLKRYSVLNYFDGSHLNLSQALNKIDILDNLQNKTNKNLNWKNDDDEWVELEDPEAITSETSPKPTSAKKSKVSRPSTSTRLARQKFAEDLFLDDFDGNFSWDESTIPEIFKRMKNEPWWDLEDTEETNDLRSMLLYLIETIKAKQPDSYESACNYLVEIFRTYGIEPSLINQILDILIDHLQNSSNDPLDVYTVRTIAQFMIDRKNIIVSLLEYALKCPPTDILRHEAINAVKYITDVNSSDDIDLALNNMPIVRDAAEDTFSLKMIIERIKDQMKRDPSAGSREGTGIGSEADGGLHPLLKKISEERWFPRDNVPVTLDSIIDAILLKLPNASKTMLKTLTSHLVQMNRDIGYTDEQFNRILKALIALLSHSDADYRLIAATILAELGRETKAVDIALLDAFVNDARILVRTECCDTLKKLTGITSDTVLKDCAEDLPYLKTLPEEGFTLQGYWKEKNRLPTPPPGTTEEQPSDPAEQQQQEGEGEEQVEFDFKGQDDVAPETEGLPHDENEGEDREDGKDGEEEEVDILIDEAEATENQPVTDETEQEPIDDEGTDPTSARSRPRDDSTEKTKDGKPSVRFRSPSPPVDQRPAGSPKRVQGQTPSQVSVTPSGDSSTAVGLPAGPPIRVEISEKQTTNSQPRKPVPRSRRDAPAVGSQTPRMRKPPTVPLDPPEREPIKLHPGDPVSSKRSLLRPNNTEMWDSYEKQHEMDEARKREEDSQAQKRRDQHHETFFDPVRTITDEHKRNFGYYRMHPNRQILIPHKVSLGDVFGDQSHMTLDRRSSHRPTSFAASSMHLSDLNQNKRKLRDVESMQLLSSLVIRSIQVHRKHVPFIPGSMMNNMDSDSNFADALAISQMHLHSSSFNGFPQSNLQSPHRLPPIIRRRPSSAHAVRDRSDAITRATRAGVNIRKAQDMEDLLSHLLQPEGGQGRSALAPHSTPHPASTPEDIDEHEITHARLLENLLRVQGRSNPPNQIQQILRAYPKFAPLLNSRVPASLVSVISSDSVVKQLASIIGNAQDESTLSPEEEPVRRSHTKASIPPFDDEHSSNFFDYSAPIHLTAMQQQQREEHQKKILPPVRGFKARLPRHVLKFGFREIELDSPEASIESLRDESVSKSRRRRIYMHLMFARHELVKSQLRQMLKTEYRGPYYLPIIARPPMCN